MRLALLTLLGLLSLASQGPAQAPPARLEGAASDSAARARVLQHVWEILAPELLAASLDSTARAWTIAVPADSFPWTRAAAHLRHALRARDPLPGDTAIRRLTVSAVRIERDTAWATVTTDYEQHCAPGARPGGWGNRHNVFVPRVGPQGPWGPARSRNVLHGVRATCRPRAP